MTTRNAALISGRGCRIVLGLLSGLLLIGMGGCRTRSSVQSDAVVRLIDAAPEAQDLSVAVDDQRVWKHAEFGSSTGYQGVRAGNYKIDIAAESSGSQVTGQSYLPIEKGKAYTVVALNRGFGSAEPPALRVFSDPMDDPVPPGKARLHFINAAAGLDSADVLFDNIVGFAGVSFSRRSAALLLDPGAYDVKVDVASEALPSAGPISLHFLPGHSYTVVAMGHAGSSGASEGLSVEMYPDSQ